MVSLWKVDLYRPQSQVPKAIIYSEICLLLQTRILLMAFTPSPQRKSCMSWWIPNKEQGGILREVIVHNVHFHYLRLHLPNKMNVVSTSCSGHWHIQTLYLSLTTFQWVGLCLHVVKEMTVLFFKPNYLMSFMDTHFGNQKYLSWMSPVPIPGVMVNIIAVGQRHTDPSWECFRLPIPACQDGYKSRKVLVLFYVMSFGKYSGLIGKYIQTICCGGISL